MKARRIFRIRRHIKFVSSFDIEERIVSKEEFMNDVDAFIAEAESKMK